MRSTVLVFSGLLLGAGVAFGGPLDKPAFTATPAELLAAAKAALPTGGVTGLRLDEDVRFDDHARVTDRWRAVFVVNTNAGAAEADTLTYEYRPSFQDRVRIRARVIDPQGNVAELDPKLARENPTAKDADRVEGSAQLPKLVAGSVVETEVVIADREPMSVAGASVDYRIGARDSTHLTIAAPASLKVRTALHGLAVRPAHATSGGVETWTYAIGATTWPQLDPFMPADLDLPPHLLASSIASWNALAKALTARTEAQIAAGPIALAPELPRTPTVETARAILAWLQTRVTADRVNLPDAPLTPASPADTLKRGRADDLAIAVAYVALLRQAGIAAEIALIDEGTGRDVEPDMPALDDLDHALIRAHLAGREVWIDPTADALALPLVPPADCHRRALVLAAATTALAMTPAMAAADSVLHETRTFELADAGYAHVTEVRRIGGLWNLPTRVSRRDDPKAFEQEWTDDTKSRLDAKAIDRFTTTDPSDVTHPFEVTSVMTSQRGFTKRALADVWLFPNDVTWALPDLLTKSDVPTRVHDYAWAWPHVYEIENRIVVPEGYAMPAVADRTRQLGALTFSETQKIAGNVLIVTMRLDTGKLRLNPVEVAATRAAVAAFGAERDHIVFPNIAHQLFDKGAWKDAIVEANRVIRAQPKNGKRHAALAEMLVNMGLDDAARREARLAVQIQPDNADNHVVLAWTLAHDAFGRSYTEGADRAGALAELEKARKLDPKHVGAAGELGNVLAHGDRGKLWGHGADVKASAAAKRIAYELEPSASHAEELVRALLWSGDFVGAAKIAKDAPRSDDHDALWLAAVAGSEGAPAAIRAADSLSSADARKRALGGAGSILLVLRHYTDARALFTEIGSFGSGTPQGAIIAQLAQHDRPLDRKTPAGAAIEAELAFIREDKPQGIWDAKTEAELAFDWHDQLRKAPAAFTLSDELYADVVRSGVTSHVEGDKKAWRIELASVGKPEVLYAAEDHGTIKLIGAAANTHGVGRHALRLIANNDLDTARRLLDWVEKDGKRNVMFEMFEMVWGPNHANDREAVELAAAVLTGTSDQDHARPILEKCAGAPPKGDLACAVVLAELSNLRGAWDETIAQLTARLAAHPKEPFTARMLALAQAFAGRPKEAEAVLRDLPPQSDNGFKKLQVEIAVAENDVPAAIQIAEAATKAAKPSAADFNQLAWLEVVANTKLADAVVAAGEAVRLDSNAATLHTKALAEAESGDLRAALEDDHKAISQRLHAAPANGDWYLLGRIAELVGLPEDAIAAYHHVKPLPVRFSGVPESDILAKRRLAALGKP